MPRDLRKPGMIAAGALAALVLVIALIVWLVRRSRRGGAPVPQEPPYDRAIRRLRVLRNAPAPRTTTSRRSPSNSPKFCATTSTAVSRFPRRF
ncbi:MAG: hypothetical protein M5R36_17985 [Deltaproteobacteria bacterium]|nr:hypothetical protein [Deltaproteobacteria bacterium]